MSLRNLIHRVDLVSLQLFIAVCEERNLTRAADRESISPSALSKRLSDLERILGAELFLRHAKGMMLTDAGTSLLRHARRIVSSVLEMGSELREHASGIRGNVNILANISVIVEFLPEDLYLFSQVHNLIKINLEQRISPAVVKGIEDKVAEIGICEVHGESGNLKVWPYRSDRLVVIARDDHPLAALGQVPFADTLDFEYVGFHVDCPVYSRSRFAAARLGRELKAGIHLPGFDTVCRIVESGLGVALMPDRAFELVGSGMNLVAIPLLEEWAARELKIVTRDPNTLSRPARLLMDHLMKIRAPVGSASTLGLL